MLSIKKRSQNYFKFYGWMWMDARRCCIFIVDIHKIFYKISKIITISPNNHKIRVFLLQIIWYFILFIDFIFIYSPLHKIFEDEKEEKKEKGAIEIYGHLQIFIGGGVISTLNPRPMGRAKTYADVLLPGIIWLEVYTRKMDGHVDGRKGGLFFPYFCRRHKSMFPMLRGDVPNCHK